MSVINMAQCLKKGGSDFITQIKIRLVWLLKKLAKFAMAATLSKIQHQD